MWSEISNIIRRVAKQFFRESEWCWQQAKESWWWCGEVQKALEEKKNTF